MIVKNFFFEVFEKGFFTVIKIKKRIFSGKTKFQTAEIFETDSLGKILVLDGALQTTEKDDFLYHEALVHPAMISHCNPKKVLIIGGGDGGVAAEVLKHDIDEAVMVEIDGEVVDISKKYMPEISKGSFENPKLKLEIGDGRKYVEETDKKFDVIIHDLTDPTGPAKFLYTKEYFEMIAKKLNGGIMVIQCSIPFSFPTVFNVIIKTLRSVFKQVNFYFFSSMTYGGEFGLVMVSNEIDLDKVDISGERIEKLKDLKWYSQDLHKNLYRIPKYVEEALKEEVKISTDDEPLEFQDYWDVKDENELKELMEK